MEGAGEDSIFSMVDNLSSRIREHLGVSAGWGEEDQGIADLSTDSVQALGFYQEGLALIRAGNQLDAATALERAVEADPEFGVAQAMLAETYDRMGHAQKAVEAAERAAQGLAAASPYEAAHIRAVRARLNSDLDEAREAYQSLVDVTPNSAEARFDLGSVQEDAGDLEEALASFQKVVEKKKRTTCSSRIYDPYGQNI